VGVKKEKIFFIFVYYRLAKSDWLFRELGESDVCESLETGEPIGD
jgi:hypothetical protein